MNKIPRLIAVAISTLVICILVFAAVSFHIDGYKNPKIIVTITDRDGKPLAESSVIFLDFYWCHNNLWNELNKTSNQLSENKEEFLRKSFLAYSDSRGHAEVKGHFRAAISLFGTNLHQEGELIVEKAGYEPINIKLNDKKYRHDILKGRINLEIKMDKKG
jgi:hypothetical protein